MTKQKNIAVTSVYVSLGAINMQIICKDAERFTFSMSNSDAEKLSGKLIDAFFTNTNPAGLENEFIDDSEPDDLDINFNTFSWHYFMNHEIHAGREYINMGLEHDNLSKIMQKFSFVCADSDWHKKIRVRFDGCHKKEITDLFMSEWIDFLRDMGAGKFFSKAFVQFVFNDKTMEVCGNV